MSRNSYINFIADDTKYKQLRWHQNFPIDVNNMTHLIDLFRKSYTNKFINGKYTVALHFTIREHTQFFMCVRYRLYKVCLVFDSRFNDLRYEWLLHDLLFTTFKRTTKYKVWVRECMTR